MGYPHEVGTRVVFDPAIYGRKYGGVVVSIQKNPHGGQRVRIEYHRFFEDTPDSELEVNDVIYDPCTGYYNHWEVDHTANPLEVY